MKVLTGMDPPLITAEQLAEAKVALTPEAPPPVEVAEGEEAPEPVEPVPPTDEELLMHFLTTNVITEEQVAQALADAPDVVPEAPAE